MYFSNPEHSSEGGEMSEAVRVAMSLAMAGLISVSIRTGQKLRLMEKPQQRPTDNDGWRDLDFSEPNNNI